jgi:hypothetical protein
MSGSKYNPYDHRTVVDDLPRLRHAQAYFTLLVGQAVSTLADQGRGEFTDDALLSRLGDMKLNRDELDKLGDLLLAAGQKAITHAAWLYGFAAGQSEGR